MRESPALTYSPRKRGDAEKSKEYLSADDADDAEKSSRNFFILKTYLRHLRNLWIIFPVLLYFFISSFDDGFEDNRNKLRQRRPKSLDALVAAEVLLIPIRR